MSDTLIEPLLLDPSVEAKAPVVSRRKSTAIGWIRKPGLVIPVLIVLLAIGFAVAPGFFASGDPLSGVPADKLQGRAWLTGSEPTISDVTCTHGSCTAPRCP